MKSELFISRQEFEDIIEISSHCGYDSLSQFILTTQDTLLHDKLGGGFYYDLLQNHCEDAYKPVMNGSEYLGCEDETLYHKGIKFALAYLSYAQKIKAGDAHDTPFGTRKKVSMDSVPLTDSETANQYNYYHNVGMSHLSRTLDYLCRNKETFTAFKGHCEEVVSTPRLGGSSVLSNSYIEEKGECNDCR